MVRQSSQLDNSRCTGFFEPSHGSNVKKCFVARLPKNLVLHGTVAQWTQQTSHRSRPVWCARDCSRRNGFMPLTGLSMASLRFVRSHVHVSLDETGDTSRTYCVECVSTLPFLSLHLRQLRRILCYCFLKAATLQSASGFSKRMLKKAILPLKFTKENVLCFPCFSLLCFFECCRSEQLPILPRSCLVWNKC